MSRKILVLDCVSTTSKYFLRFVCTFILFVGNAVECLCLPIVLCLSTTHVLGTSALEGSADSNLEGSLSALAPAPSAGAVDMPMEGASHLPGSTVSENPDVKPMVLAGATGSSSLAVAAGAAAAAVPPGDIQARPPSDSQPAANSDASVKPLIPNSTASIKSECSLQLMDTGQSASLLAAAKPNSPPNRPAASVGESTASVGSMAAPPQSLIIKPEPIAMEDSMITQIATPTAAKLPPVVSSPPAGSAKRKELELLSC